MLALLLTLRACAAAASASGRLAKLGFDRGRLLGRGFFGSVYEAKVVAETGDYKLGQLVAIKEIEDPAQGSENEISALLTLQSPHAVRCLRVLRDAVSGHVLLVFEHCAGGDLQSFLSKQTRAVDEKLLLGWLKQLLDALVVLADKRAVHGDIALRNVLLVKAGDELSAVKLADFGLAQWAAGSAAVVKHSSRSVAPECADGMTKPTPLSDVWSLGCLLLQLMTLDADCMRAAMMAEAKSDAGDARGSGGFAKQKQLDKAVASAAESAGYSKLLVDVVQRMLTIDPSQRISAQSALSRVAPTSEHLFVAMIGSDLLFSGGPSIDFSELMSRKLPEVFVGREWMFAKIKAWLDEKKTPTPFLLITGDPGVGKSALVVELRQRRFERTTRIGA